MNNTRIALAGGLAAIVLALGGCGGGGGGGGDDAPAPAVGQVPPEAFASTAAFVAYLKATPANDTAESLSLGGRVPPSSETEEPVEID